MPFYKAFLLTIRGSINDQPFQCYIHILFMDESAFHSIEWNEFHKMTPDKQKKSSEFGWFPAYCPLFFMKISYVFNYK